MQSQRIPLLNRAREVVAYAIVDDDMFAALSAVKWHRDTAGYAVNSRSLRGHPERMHRIVLGLGRGDPHVDHINLDKLDNRRANLRLATHEQNVQNGKAHVGGSSRFRGVYWVRRDETWAAQAMCAGRSNWIGCFDDELTAALAVDEWRQANMPFAGPDPALADIPAADLAAARNAVRRARGPGYRRRSQTVK